MDIVKGVRHAPVQLVLLEDSYHMITIDRERRKVNELCINFAIERSLADENVAELISTPGTLSEPSGGCL